MMQWIFHHHYHYHHIQSYIITICIVKYISDYMYRSYINTYIDLDPIEVKFGCLVYILWIYILKNSNINTTPVQCSMNITNFF